MPDLTDFLEALFTGRWKYLAGLTVGTFVYILIRIIRHTWSNKQEAADAAFVQQHVNIPVASLRKEANRILLSLALLLIVVLPGTLWLTVQVLESNPSLSDGQKLLITFALVLVLILVLAVQALRLRRLRRRVKRLEHTQASPEEPTGSV